MEVIPVKRALALVSSALNNYGYMISSKGIGTRYFTKMGTHLKIRVSDHFDRGKNHDVCADVVIEAPTIMSDIGYRAKNADATFKAAVRNIARKKAS